MAFRTEITRRSLLLATGTAAFAQQIVAPKSPAVLNEPPEKPVEFICPMDADVRQKGPGKCPRCGMKLVAGLPDAVEYHLDIVSAPKRIQAGKPVKLTFSIANPKTGKPVRDFEVVHEKLFHLFILHQNLDLFAHEHPVKTSGPEFTFEYTFPKPGMYRILADYYPVGGTPQLTVKTLFVGDGPGAPIPISASNTKVQLSPEPEKPIAGLKTRLYFTLEPHAGLVPWLGAWGHVLVASRDLIDLIHTHPFIADGGEKMQFNVIFPRPVPHRVWMQFERQGVVNTSSFDVDVTAL